MFLRDVAPRLGGRFWVETDSPAAAGEHVELTIELDGANRTCDGTARVVSSEPMRMCLRFVELEGQSPQFALGLEGHKPDDVLLPGMWRERPHPFTEAPTPAFGTPVPKIILPNASPPTPPAALELPSSSPWSGGLRPLDTIRNYQLLERLGRGGMAEVYVARQVFDDGVEKLVALKLALPEYGPGTPHGGLFLDEARISASLQHKGLIQVFDFGEALGRPFLAMEYVRGRDLGTLLKRAKHNRPPQWPAFSRQVVLEMLHALEYLHSRSDPSGEYLRLVHRDISPANVLVSEFGEVKIIDFGVASIFAPEGGARIVAGKPGYMPPEQAQGKAPNPGWDLYAAGVVLGELLAPGHSEVAARATNPDPDLRFISARQMIDALTAELGGEPAVELGSIVHALCGDVLFAEKRRVDEATVKARAERPATRGVLERAVRAAVRTPQARARSAAAAVVLLIAAGLAARGAFSARALDRDLQRIDERMSTGALGGSDESALAALDAARSRAPRDERVQARAAELARVFELMATTASARGNDAEALVHLEALASADPGRPGVLGKLIAAHAKQRELSVGP